MGKISAEWRNFRNSILVCLFVSFYAFFQQYFKVFNQTICLCSGLPLTPIKMVKALISGYVKLHKPEMCIAHVQYFLKISLMTKGYIIHIQHITNWFSLKCTVLIKKKNNINCLVTFISMFIFKHCMSIYPTGTLSAVNTNSYVEIM
jgi:hypothetical protein